MDPSHLDTLEVGENKNEFFKISPKIDQFEHGITKARKHAVIVVERLGMMDMMMNGVQNDVHILKFGDQPVAISMSMRFSVEIIGLHRPH